MGIVRVYRWTEAVAGVVPVRMMSGFSYALPIAAARWWRTGTSPHLPRREIG
jgi:hypothetical protein